MIQVIHRHGAREHLEKNPIDLGFENEAYLISTGQAEVRKLGSFIRDIFITGSQLNKAYQIDGIPQDEFNHSLVKVYSSNLQRTMASAAGVAIGLYPDAAIPIETGNSPDLWIRAYAKCPKIDSYNKAWYESTEFKNKERESEALRESYSDVADDVSLKNWFNVYDRAVLYNLYGPWVPGILPMKTLNYTQRLALMDLADWVEAHKFSRQVQQGGIGGLPLMGQIGTNFKKFVDIHQSSNPNQLYPKLISYSGHYPTLFSVLAGWGMPYITEEYTSTIPGYASALVFILEENIPSPTVDPVLKIRLFQIYDSDLVSFQNNLSFAPLNVSSVCGTAGGGLSCAYSDFMKAAQTSMSMSLSTWCSQCGATTADTPLCNRTGSSSSTCSSCSMDPALAGFIGAIVTIGVGLVLFLLYVLLRNRRFKKQVYSDRGNGIVHDPDEPVGGHAPVHRY